MDLQGIKARVAAAAARCKIAVYDVAPTRVACMTLSLLQSKHWPDCAVESFQVPAAYFPQATAFTGTQHGMRHTYAASPALLQ
jgi:hypothetical protein